jgi:adenylyltransferase/sulfurtransferase
MPKRYQDLVAEAKREVAEISAEEVCQKVLRGDDFVILDVRDPDEFRAGHLQGALSISRGMLEFRVREALPSSEKPIVVYCAAGFRSLLAGQVLKVMGYPDVRSMAGGIRRWRDLGYPVLKEEKMNPEQLQRYSRHILLPHVGEKGQQKLLAAKVLLVGAGGLGSPAAIYLAAAGVGRLGIVDSDKVDLSNLQRQILHFSKDVGRPKTESAQETIKALNPDISVTTYGERLDSSNVNQIIGDYDLILDGADNFPTKYLLNDACHFAGKPLIYGSIFQFEGQATVFHRGQGPCYRCLFPVPPPPGLVPT